MEILTAYDVPPKLVNAIQLMYQNTRVKGITPDADRILVGVFQGDTLTLLICNHD